MVNAKQKADARKAKKRERRGKHGGKSKPSSGDTKGGGESRKRKKDEVVDGGQSKSSISNTKIDHKDQQEEISFRKRKKDAHESPSLEAGARCAKDTGGAAWSKSKKKRMRLLKAKLTKKDGDITAGGGILDPLLVNPHSSVTNDNVSVKNSSKSSALQDSFKARLSGSRFRILNEELYTSISSLAYEKFSSNPELYDQYHDGFRHQVKQWPVNPIDTMVKSILKELHKKNKSKNVEPLVVADFGCGDAELGKQLLAVKMPQPTAKTSEATRTDKKKCPFIVHSFDLVAASDIVTACDMAHVPIGDKTVDVGVFCLSLMGTNLADFIREAHRVLKDTGRLKIAEVRSRFETNTSAASEKTGKKKNKDQPQQKQQRQTHPSLLADFMKVLEQLGFESVGDTDFSNKMFLVLDLKKNGKKPQQDISFTAKPCIYKRR